MAGVPKYQTVADVLRREIAEGIFTDGQTLMTEEELRARFQVSRQTVRQAIAMLEDDGLVDRRRGSGTYVHHGPRRHQGPLTVGVVTTYITDYIFPSIMRGIESVLNANGCIMNVAATCNDSHNERTILDRLMSQSIDGLIVEGCRTAEPTPNRECYNRLIERNIPILFFNGYYPEEQRIPHVVMDDYEGGRLAARELIRRGYRKPAGFFKQDDMQGKERARGFLDEMKEFGIFVPETHMLWFDTSERETFFGSSRGRSFVTMMAAGLEVDSLAAYNDVFAYHIINGIRELTGHSPRNLGIISFDDTIYAEMSRPSLTTLVHPKEAFGALAAEKMLRMINGEQEQSVEMAWQLKERDSLPEKNV